EPELIIVDEPFASLDPVNTQMVKELMKELREQGTTIIMCTHQMHHAEVLCDRFLLVAEGRVILEGPLDDVRRRFAGHAVLVRAAGDLPLVTGVRSASQHNHATKWELEEGATPQDVLKALLAENVTVEQFEIAVPPLAEIFIRAVEGAT
ncbi:MAG TPA: DUF4162 domain-containing protein, partial [Anaerolineae bacterium]|nr:DUF4162 domain-containing protein [Anaerolineae bacterium]